MERSQDSKIFRVVLHVCPPERPQIGTADTKAFIRVFGTNSLTVDTGRGQRTHALDFDAVWREGASSRDIYESTAKPLVENVMKGFNGCVISHGPSTSDDTNTHTTGSRLGGLISYAAEDLFNSTEAAHSSFRVSFYHISNEKIYDLLEPQPSEVFRVHDTEEAVLLEGLKEMDVDSPQDLMDVYRRGIAHRNIGISKGDFACRSHMVFNIWVINRHDKFHNDGVLKASFLSLVELASPSKSAHYSSSALDFRKSIHVTSENPQEAKTLKRSLAIFRNVIFSLSTAGCHHVPYRESKLTRVLRVCLGGNCRTCLLVNVPARSSSVTEILSCLQFAAQAMNIPHRQIHPSQIYLPPGVKRV